MSFSNALVASDRNYAALNERLVELRAALDTSRRMVGPFEMAKRDPELKVAGDSLSKVARELNQELSARPDS